MIQKMASPNHRIIVDPSILAQATARRQVTSEFSDDLLVQLHPGQHLTQGGLHSYLKSTTQRDTSALRSSRCLLEMERDSRHITFLGTSDRDVMLSPKLLTALRTLWRYYHRKSSTWLFPSNYRKDRPIDTKTVWRACQK